MDPTPEPIAGLVRDHRQIEEVAAASHRAISAAAGRPLDANIVATAIAQLRDLEAFAAIELTIHIAKEEEVLFPEIRRVAKLEVDTIIGDMLAQHDEVRDRGAEVRKVLDALDRNHDEVTGETAKLSDGLRVAGECAPGELPLADVLNSLYDSVKKLDWILQGHFVDEEDNLFEPAIAWFNDADFANLIDRMAKVEASYS
ncbi:MAG: hemerythrin domain-containing protein [Tepidiformaceae bacterium]